MTSTARAGLTPFTLENGFVRLEPLTTGHTAALAAAARGDRGGFSLTTVPAGPDEAREYVHSALARQATGREVPFAVRRLPDDRIVGTTRFLDLERFDGTVPSDDHPPGAAEIGSTWYAVEAQRTPVNTGCKLLLLTHAFETWGCLRITFKTDARNQTSRRAIERIGGVFEGIRRRHVPAADGTIRDSAYFSIVREEWPGVRARLTALAAR